ncbi:putative dTDP-4-dehydrorhamnose 3,5-epimerase [Magnetofaba australis IT-1]|uniref:dTDP-4-dehydrorhamnose 3,5-epimerase n=1 Tax=Magnetofaba australis IT-1 TaxID=1434232 RepID=A0A1Y2K721_9PROT|nr:putative dTDP-4-dehydrorhamnose 3,5-epimerase [Magnetofaba australis IT-1]
MYGDDRGYFFEAWRQKELREAGIDAEFVQMNQSGSQRGVLRGLHYQIQQPQGKLVRVLRGEIFDVAVDLRRSSPTFGQWDGWVLNDVTREGVWIPPGFAHGFLTLSERAEFEYLCTDTYAPQWERAIRWDDPDLAIVWPQLEGALTLSQKDQDATAWRDAELFP